MKGQNTSDGFMVSDCAECPACIGDRRFETQADEEMDHYCQFFDDGLLQTYPVPPSWCPLREGMLVLVADDMKPAPDVHEPPVRRAGNALPALLVVLSTVRHHREVMCRIHTRDEIVAAEDTMYAALTAAEAVLAGVGR